MFQLLQPIWLCALAGLSIPVIIHLWNQRPGKTLRVGSIALVAENAVSHKKNVKLTEILLLLLRCLLLACIAVALTNPFWKSPVNKMSKGWVLMSRNDLPATYNHFKPVVDSLLHAGMEFHYFEDGFVKEDFQKAIGNPADTAVVKQTSYRGIVSSLNEVIDAKTPLYIFTDNYLRNFTGKRTAVSLGLHWFTYTPDTTAAKPVFDSTTLHITVYNHAHPNDARYVTAALDAIQQFSKRNIIIKTANNVTEITANQDWLFWLSEEEIPAETKTSNVFAYAKGSAMPDNSYILPAVLSSFDAVELHSSVIKNDSANNFVTVYWKDGFGHPLLAEKTKENTNYYTLYTHIDPAWNELPWSSSFPQMLYHLLYATHSQNKLISAADKTIIDSSQLIPILLSGKEAGIKPVLFESTKLESFFWLTAFILLLAERLLSFYHHKLFANG